MNRFLAVFSFVLLIIPCFGQDINILMKLNDACVRLGSSRKIPVSNLQMEESIYKINGKMAQHMEFLLQSAEYYLSGDYEHSDYYIKQVRMNFRNIEYNNLKLLLMTCNFARSGDVKNAARHYYIIRKINQMEPGNMEVLYKEIAANLDRASFDDALAHYFYYHQRLKILDTIYNTKVPGSR